MKILILGHSGSGKSTLAIELGKIYSLNVLHIDNVQFYGDWLVRNKDEKEMLINQFIDANNNGYIIDGNYLSLATRRFLECDLIIYLNYNRFYCYKKAKERYKKNLGKTRESCPCEEKFDFEFKKWILFEGRTLKKKRKIRNLLNSLNCDKKVFTHVKQKELYLSKLKESSL